MGDPTATPTVIKLGQRTLLLASLQAIASHFASEEVLRPKSRSMVAKAGTAPKFSGGLPWDPFCHSQW